MVTGTNVVGEVLRHAIELAGRAPSIHNSQPWAIAVSPGRIDLHADRERWLPVTDADRRDLFLSCGAVLHHLRVALAAGGVGAAVRRLPDPAQPDLVASVELDGHGESIDPTLSEQIERRRSDRRAFRNYPIPEAYLRDLAARAAEQGALLRVVDDAAARAALVAAFAEAATTQSGQPGYGEELRAWTDREGGDGIPAGNLVRPVPPAVEVARDFGGAAEPGAEAMPEEATLLVVGTASDDRLSQLRAGEAMSAVLLEATRQGLASCPLSQALEVGATREMLQDRVLGTTLSPQIVLRIGWGPREPLPATPRRPVEDIIRQPSP
jgi:nitroreductase